MFINYGRYMCVLRMDDIKYGRYICGRYNAALSMKTIDIYSVYVENVYNTAKCTSVCINTKYN